MTADPFRHALAPNDPAIEADAATDILRMLTSDRVEPMLRCNADGVDRVEATAHI